MVFVYGIKSAPNLKSGHVWLLGLALIILGNLGQGDWDTGFLKPFYASGIQYYHDAIKINSWTEWLGSFNESQDELLTHTKTHPPFAVLIHYWLLKAVGYHLSPVAIVFTLISSLSIIFVWHILKVFDTPPGNRNLIAILFSVIPAINIYSAVSLDGVILTTSTIFLFGTVILYHAKKPTLLGLLSLLIGLVTTNLLTYGGVFLIAVAGILALEELLLYKKSTLAISLSISVGIFILLIALLFSTYGYNHFQGFLTAAALENPDGFRGLATPMEYIATRVEGVCEILLFLSIGFVAMFFHPDRLGFSWFDWRRAEVSIMLAGIVVLLAMFISGAYRTGETARAALFIYPYLILSLTKTNRRVLKNILWLAGLQTLGMQLVGGYFW